MGNITHKVFQQNYYFVFQTTANLSDCNIYLFCNLKIYLTPLIIGDML